MNSISQGDADSTHKTYDTRPIDEQVTERREELEKLFGRFLHGNVCHCPLCDALKRSPDSFTKEKQNETKFMQAEGT